MMNRAALLSVILAAFFHPVDARAQAPQAAQRPLIGVALGGGSALTPVVGGKVGTIDLLKSAEKLNRFVRAEFPCCGEIA